MASVHRKSASKFWFAFFRDHTGRLRSKSTKQTAKSKALRVAQAWERLAQRKLLASEVREATNEIVREIYGSEVPFTTPGTYFEQWLKLKRPELADSTFQSYRKSIDKFLRFLGEQANRDIATARKHRIVEFRNSLIDKVSPATANVDLRLIKTVFQAAKDDGYLSESPAQGVDPFRRTGRRTRRPFSIDELRQVIEAADPEWQSMIRFGLYTGQRLGDLARLRWENIDLTRGLIKLKARKTARLIVVPIAPALRDHIATLPIPEDPLQPIHPNCSRRQSNRLSNEFRELLARVGLRAPRGRHTATGLRRDIARRPSELSFHSLRHTMASLLETAGVPRATVQAITGHSSDAMSELYTHVGLEALQQAALALPAL